MARSARNPLFRRSFRPTLPLRLQVEALEDRSVPTVFTVTNNLDAGSGSLRQAILDSNALPGADEIRFDTTFFAVPRTITLTTAELRVRDDLTVTGPGAGLLAVSGNNARRVFNIDDGTSGTHRAVRIEGLTITGGRGITGGGISNRESLDLLRVSVTGNTTFPRFVIGVFGGGGIANSGTLTVTDSTISGNTSLLDGGGGGIYNLGILTLVNTTVSANTATTNGGGIANQSSSATTTLINSTVSGNTAGRDGGGIANPSVSLNPYAPASAGSLSLINSTVTGNTAGRDGGGVATASSYGNYYDDTTTSSSLINTTVGDNRAGRDGGGVANSGILAVANSVISGNTADRDGGGVANLGNSTLINTTVSDNQAVRDGGGVANSGTLTLTNATVSGNTAGWDGGGVANSGGYYGSPVNITLTNSTVSGNTAGQDGGGVHNAGTMTLTNSTVSGNTAVREGGGLDNGGVESFYFYGEYYSFPVPGRATLTQVTVAGNAAATGGNISNGESSRLALANSLVADAVAGGDVYRASGDQLILSWVNLVEDGSVTGAGVLNADANLGPLADNGGPTKTRAPLPGSPAVDAGDNAVLTPAFLTDQRGAGFSRLRGAGRVDLGAVEASPPPGTVTFTPVAILAREGDPAADTLVFTFRRTSEPSAPLDVPAAFGGTASPGDYVVGVAGGTQTPTGFRFAAGSAELTVTLAIVDDPAAELAETVILSVGPGPGYPADAAFAVIERDFDTQVTTTADDGSGSLRVALRNADDRPGADAVTFDPVVFSTPRTITLASGPLSIRTDVTIAGPGAGLLTVSGNNASRVFNIDDGDDDTFRSVLIEGLTVTGGRSTGDGGGIRNAEALELVGCTVSGNTAGFDGGGIAQQYGSLELVGSTVSGNTAGRDGGGVSVVAGYYSSGDVSATLIDCTVSGNTAGRDGGGVANDTGTVTLVNSTVSGNTAGREGGGLSNRGSYYYYYSGSSTPGRATLSQVTVAGNAAPTGGNIANGGAGELTLANSIVADAVTGGDVSGDFESLTLSGVNLVEDGSVAGPGVINADPKLGPLADNGGPTKTHTLLPGSPAFNAASPAAVPAGLLTDQRGTGFGRNRGGGVDLGAFEVQTSRITAAADAPSTPEDAAVTVAVLANDADEYGTPLAVTAVGAPSSGTAVLNPDGTVTYTPAANFNGTATFTYTVTNAFGDTQTGAVEVTVTAVNDAPTVIAPAATHTTAEDVPVVITGISVADVDAAEGTGWVRVTLSVGFGTLTVPTTVAGGLTAVQISGNGTGELVLEGPLAAVNATLAAGVTYLGNVNFSGNETLGVVVNDLGNTGAGGPLGAAAAVPVRVVSAADQLADLRARVVALGAEGVLNGGQTNSLLVKLDQAARKLADGQVRVAYNLIGAFAGEVEALRAGGVLSPEQADPLLVLARRLRLSLLVGGW